MTCLLASESAESAGLLLELLVMLLAALVVGTVFERFKQSAIVGYLLAGTIIGPNVLGLVPDSETIRHMAELGVALLLFAIGLEFSFQRLMKLGNVALIGGGLQVLITTAAVLAVWMAFGFDFLASLALGAMAAMSSTACVLRVLTDRAALDSVHGRNAVGILLVQDVMVIPFTLLVSAIALPSDEGSPWWAIGKTVAFGGVLVAGFVLLFNVIVPRLLNLGQWSTNRELPVLLAIVMAVGSALAAQYAGLSPAIGAFLAGVLLAASPFAVQITADIASARTVLVTVFFASVGMLADPVWAAKHAYLVLPVFLAVLVGKAAIVWLLLWLLRVPSGIALASGLCIAQVGEFSFVLGQIGQNGGLFNETVNKLTIAATTLTLIATPYLVQYAPKVADWLESLRTKTPKPASPAAPEVEDHDRLLLIGFGPAGQRVAEALLEHLHKPMHVLELSTKNAARAKDYGLQTHIGDARSAEVLEHLGIRRCFAVVITLPDPAIARQVIYLIRSLHATAQIVVRSRYHVARWELMMAGAETVVDEEEQVGLKLANEVLKQMVEHGQIAPTR